MVNLNNLSAAEQFYKDILLEKNPDLGLSEADPLFDLLVRPAVHYKIPGITDALVKAKQTRSLLNFSMDTNSYDELLANYFITRDLGSYKAVEVKVIYTAPVPIGLIPANTPIVIDGATFLTTGDVVINLSDFALETAEPYLNKYAILLNATAVDIGEQSTIVGGKSATISYLKGYEAAVVVSVSGGASAQTNQTAYQKGVRQVSVRNGVNDLSIKAKIATNFPAVEDVLTVGFAEPEMVRDSRLASIPKYSARLFYTAPTVVEMTPANTRFLYSNSASIIYVPYTTVNVNASSSRWQLHSNGKYFLDIEVNLLSISNGLGFKQDMPLSVSYSTTSTGAFSLYSSINPQFVGARAQVDTHTEETGGASIIHSGVSTDIYIKTPIEHRTLDMFVPVNSEGFVDFPIDVQPVLRIESIKDELGDSVSLYSLVVDEFTTRFSGQDTTRLFVNPALRGTVIKINLTCAPMVKSVHNDFNKPLERLTSGNTMVKYFNPIFISGIAQLAVDSSTLTDIESVLKTNLEVFFRTGTGGKISKSKIHEIFFQAIPSLRSVVSLNIYGQQYMPDGAVMNVSGSENIIPYTTTILGVSTRNSVFELGDWQFVFIT